MLAESQDECKGVPGGFALYNEALTKKAKRLPIKGLTAARLVARQWALRNSYAYAIIIL
jgi:hypothetical protein